MLHRRIRETMNFAAVHVSAAAGAHAYRYYRLLIEAVTSGSYATLNELEIAASVGGSDSTSGKTATASSDALWCA